MPASDTRSTPARHVAVVGGGPAGLMAAEVLAGAGAEVDLYDAMPSVGRKFLLAGKGGLNLTHSEAFSAFCSRFGERRTPIAPMLERFGAADLRAWAQGLGVATFIGSSGRVFPVNLKAAPLLRAWLHRLRGQGVRLHMRHRWRGWTGGDATTLAFETPQGAWTVHADAVVLALGGASWARLGSDGAWVPWLQSRGVDLAPLRPSNCGFDAAHVDVQGHLQPGWSEHFRSRHAGAPLKNVALACTGTDGRRFAQPGEFVITDGGVEGSLVYAASAVLRDAIEANGQAIAQLDLLPGRSAEWVAREVARPRGARSLSTHLKSRLGLDGVKAALLYELLPREVVADPQRMAAVIKALPLILLAARPLDEAISTAGGVRFEALDAQGMLRAAPGVFCAGEMLDWEAPTGGYLLTACCATGVWAGEGALRYLGLRPVSNSAAPGR
ncbi:MAG: aminoacetone oxidase family FAD-binding enzyme [Burkholderiales bacterium PBB1]|nr:MAG: aminoacetone oxidase family FAD-binding enzyme [Burkholderiales bacterium PBB1]